jgi:hypothetical protein
MDGRLVPIALINQSIAIKIDAGWYLRPLGPHDINKLRKLDFQIKMHVTLPSSFGRPAKVRIQTDGGPVRGPIALRDDNDQGDA